MANMRDVNIQATIASVYSLIHRAEQGLRVLARHDEGGGDDCWHSHGIVTSLHEAYTQLLIVSESLGLVHLNEMIRQSYDKADSHKDGICAWDRDPDGEPYLLADWELRRFASSLQSVYGLKSPSVVSKDVIEILRATQYSITDPNCFPEPPRSEADVHHRIEAVLRCVFPDLDHKPPVPKAVKNFVPDTGLPSIRTLIEYKFVQTDNDVSRVVDEILADTQGYMSSDWDKIIFLIYETRRLKKEAEWNRLLQQCDAAVGTQAIVVCGESPRHGSARRNSRHDGKQTRSKRKARGRIAG